MATDTRRRLFPSDISTITRLRRRLIGKCVRSILMFACFFGLFLFSIFHLNAYEQGILVTYPHIPGNIPVPAVEMQPAHQTTDLVAVIVHASAGSKELLPRLGIDLTHAGITSYLFDLPGYGASPIPTTDEEFSPKSTQQDVEALGEVVNFIQKQSFAGRHIPVLLIGYALGATIVGDYLLATPSEHDIVSTVLLAPLSEDIVRGQNAGNTLIITGQYDFFASTANTLFAAYCKSSTAINTFTFECENPGSGPGIREVIEPFVANSLLPLAAGTSQAILDWVHPAFPQVATSIPQPILKLAQRIFPQLKDPYLLLDPYIDWLVLGLFGLYFSLTPLCYLFIVALSIHSPPTSFSRTDELFIIIYAILSAPAAIALNFFLKPFRFLQVALAEDVIGEFLSIAMLTTLLLWLTRRIVPLPRFRQIIRQLTAGLALSLFLYLTLRWLTLFPQSPFRFTFTELEHYLTLFLLQWLVFIFYECIMQNNPRRGGEFTSVLIVKIIIVLFLVEIISLRFSTGVELLLTTWPFLFILALFSETCSICLYKHGRASIAGATVSALVMLLGVSLFFPFIQ